MAARSYSTALPKSSSSFTPQHTAISLLDKSLTIDEKPAQKTGWLEKEGGNFRTWRRRFFVLKDKVMFYFEKEEDTEPKGVVVLDGCEVKSAADYTKKKFAWQVHHPSRRTFYICSSDEEDMKEWMAAVEAHVAYDDSHTLQLTESRYLKRISVLQQQLDETHKESEERRVRLELLEVTDSELKQSQKEKDAQLASQQKIIEELQAGQADHDQALASLKAELAEKTSASLALEEKLKQTQQQLQEKTEALGRVEHDLSKARTNQRVIAKEYRKLQKQIQAMNKKSANDDAAPAMSRAQTTPVASQPEVSPASSLLAPSSSSSSSTTSTTVGSRRLSAPMPTGKKLGPRPPPGPPPK